ncbi:hypothetical protein VTK56DRAFT_233 [Thermocarpiscus australiensis]
MGSSRQPFMYEPVRKDDDRFPTAPFDPKAVTRASYEKKKPKPKPKGPLVAVGRHPDAHMVPSQRIQYKPLGRKTKGWIKGLRVVQLCLRVLEVIGAVGLVVVMVLAGLIGWIMGATLGVVILHCLYSIFHHAKPAGARTPASSAAYHLFSGVTDLCVLPLYTYGTLMTRNKSDGEGRKFVDGKVLDYMVPAVYYGLIAAAGLHVISLVISLWLGWKFRRISLMPPDMNPLEANLTSRAHKRNKSSIATTSSYSDNEKRLDAQPYDDLYRPPSIPFMHTRQGSQASVSTHDSRVNLPSRQYMITPSNRGSATSKNLKRMSAPPATSNRGSYMETPLRETGTNSSRPSSMSSVPADGRPSTGTVPSYRAEPTAATQTAQPRSAKFTETWYASESLIHRTQQRTRAAAATNQRGTYESLRHANLDLPDSDSDSDAHNENSYTYSNIPGKYDSTNDTTSSTSHPNPLRSHPPASTTTTTNTTTPRRPRTPFSRLRASILSEVSLNDRRVSGSRDIADERAAAWGARANPRNRDSSVQPDAAFCSKPYGALQPGTPPVVMIGGESKNDHRQVSSGNDYDDLGLGLGLGLGGGATNAAAVRGRRVSGKVAEEGRAGEGWSSEVWSF